RKQKNGETTPTCWFENWNWRLGDQGPRFTLALQLIRTTNRRLRFRSEGSRQRLDAANSITRSAERSPFPSGRQQFHSRDATSHGGHGSCLAYSSRSSGQ